MVYMNGGLANTEQWTGIHRHHYVIGILLQIQRKIKLIDNWSNKKDKLRQRIQRTAGEVLEPANGTGYTIIGFKSIGYTGL